MIPLPLLWFKFNPCPCHLLGGSGGIFLSCLLLQQLTNDLVPSRFYRQNTTVLLVFIVYLVDWKSKLFYTDLVPGICPLRVKLNNEADVLKALTRIKLANDWFLDRMINWEIGRLNLQKHTLLPVHQGLKCSHNLKSLHGRWLQSNEWVWLGYGSLLLFLCAGN